MRLGTNADTSTGEVIACATCGAQPDDVAAARSTWSRGVEAGRVVWTCPTCLRAHARSIEGKLDTAWW